jgi:tRNA-Thr(GGU) m(6)t(6)A37 methyltransferase TsaA
MEITYRPIGIIHSPFQSLDEMPIQPSGEASAPGSVEIFPEYIEGLKDLEGFSHITLVYHLHRVQKSKLTVTPFLDSEARGVFSTRAPARPNPIGLSTVRLEGREGNHLQVANLDVLDGTPLLDIKPYVPEFDAPQDIRLGWLEGALRNARTTQSDDRFT